MQKACVNCGNNFMIRPEDSDFYEKVSPIINGKKYIVPPPSHCPDCRQQRRLAFRNERKLYKRPCDKCQTEIISMYSPDKPYTVYCQKCWWSDRWDALSFGRDFDFNRSFFEQFAELMKVVPRPAILNRNSENSDYAPWAVDSKNMYLSAGGRYNEDCLYGMFPTRCKDCVDFIMPVNCELCYEIIDCLNCYHVLFSQLLEQCRDCFFCYDCQGCSDCFGCVGLRRAEFYFFNEKLSKEAYQKEVRNMVWTTENIQKCQTKRESLKISRPRVNLKIINSENCLGDFIKNSRQVFYGFDVQDCEDCAYIFDLREAKDCYDGFISSFGTELLYECASVLNTKSSLFNMLCWDGNYNLMYSDHCFSVNNLFGCVGLRKKQYCILNKQYSKEEYEALVGRIIEHMKKVTCQSSDPPLSPLSTGGTIPVPTPIPFGSTSEWGEFFPIWLMPFAYNETVAQEYFPMSQKDILAKGWKWHEEEAQRKQCSVPNVIIPDTIDKTDESICRQILLCEVTGKPYKIVPQELAFYKKMGLPIPRKCPEQRHKERMGLRNPRKLFERTCGKCGKAIKTTYSKERLEIIYCEDCYLKETY